MRVFKSEASGATLPHWIAYEDPQIHFFQLKDVNGKHHYFELPFPGISIYGQEMGGQISSTWPVLFATKRCPILKSGKLSEHVPLNIVPVPHTYDWGGCCIYTSRGARPTIEALFTEFWQSSATYFVEGAIANWVHNNFPKDLNGYPGGWRYFKDVKFFEAWETKYTIKTIADAPFMNLPIVPLPSRTPSLTALAPWREYDRGYELPQELVVSASI